MDLERLKMWRDALIEAEAKGRVFDFSSYAKPSTESPCGFTACLAGDLAMYGPAKELGMDIQFPTGAPMVVRLCFNGDLQNVAMHSFLRATNSDERVWINRTIFPEAAHLAYEKAAGSVTRADGLARIEAKIAEIEAKGRAR